MAEYSGRDKRLAYLFEHIGDGGTANLYGTTAPDSSITADDGTLYIQYDDTSYEVVALFSMIEQSWQEINVGGSGGGEAGSGVFIDATNIIQEFVSVKNTTATYTASQDCAIVYSLSRASGNSNYVKVDSVTVMEGYDSNGVGVETGLLYVKVGQVVDFKSTYNSNTDGYTVYGVTTHILQTALIYSTEEREVGVWTDGKPLYQKTIPVTASTSANYVDVQHGVSNIDKVVKSEGYIYYDNSPNPIERRFLPQVYYTSMDNVAASIYMVTDTSIRVAYGSWLKGLNQSKVQIEVTLFYTKTTDTAGSGTWITTGEYAHHYSTSEKVIGTWIDGKPLYERTVEIYNKSGSTAAQTLIAYNDISANIDELFIDSSASYMAAGDSRFPIMGYYDSSSWQCHVFCNHNSKNVNYVAKWGSSTFDAKITFRYTKTTD